MLVAICLPTGVFVSFPDNVQRARQCALECRDRANEQVTKILFTADHVQYWKELTAKCRCTNRLIFLPRIIELKEEIKRTSFVDCRFWLFSV